MLKYLVQSRYTTVGPDKLQTLAKEILNRFFADYNVPQPTFKVVNHTNSKWLGLCKFNRKKDTTTTIFIQRSVLGDEESLKRILTHELVHHVDFLTNTINLSPLDYKRHNGHGKFFKEQVARINGVMGENYISEISDANIVVEQSGKEVYVLVMPSFSNKEKLGFAYAVHPSVKQKEFIKRMIEHHPGTKLVKSKDVQWTSGEKIGSKKISVPREDDMVEALKRLYAEGSEAKV